MSTLSHSAGAAYATKPNIVYPGTAAEAANLATRAATRITEDPSDLVVGALAIDVPQDAGASDAPGPKQLA